MREAVALALPLPACASARAEGPRLGRPTAPDEIARFDIGIGPSGMARAGRPVYESRCGACRGEKGESSYWPYATTVFDYVRRAMSFDAPRSLRDEEVYAVTAHLLHLEGVTRRTRPSTRGACPGSRCRTDTASRLSRLGIDDARR
jgi:cytochrome c